MSKFDCSIVQTGSNPNWLQNLDNPYQNGQPQTQPEFQFKHDQFVRISNSYRNFVANSNN